MHAARRMGQVRGSICRPPHLSSFREVLEGLQRAAHARQAYVGVTSPSNRVCNHVALHESRLESSANEGERALHQIDVRAHPELVSGHLTLTEHQQQNYCHENTPTTATTAADTPCHCSRRHIVDVVLVGW